MPVRARLAQDLWRPLGQRQALLCLALATALPAARASADLTTLSLEQLMDLRVVTASKYAQKQNAVAAAVSIVTRDEIRAFGWRTLDEALASLPGQYTTYDRQYSYLGMRGFGLPGDFNTRVLVTLNGHRLNDPVYDQGPFGRTLPIDLDLVERIEFIPGPGGAVYGQNAMFGVVNIVTRSGEDVAGTELAMAVQRPAAQTEGRASWGGRLDNGVDVLLSVSGLQASGEDRFYSYGASGMSGVAAGLDFERTRQVFARVQSGPWSADMVQGVRRKGDPTAAYLADPLVPGDHLEDRYQLAQLHYQQRFAADTLQLSARLFTGRYRFNGQAVFGTAVNSRPAGDWRGAELQLVGTAVDRHTLMLGLELQDNVRQDQTFIDVAHPANNVFIPGSGYRYGVFGQDEWRATDTLSATLGLRVDRSDSTGAHLSPRLAMIWQAGETTTWKALYGRAQRAPNANERDYSDGVSQVSNPSLGGERIETAELVVDHRVGADLGLRASLYQWSLSDLISLGIDPLSGLSQYQSGRQIKARGLEMSADKTWRTGARLRGSVSAQDAAYAGGGGLLNSPRLLGKLNLSAPLPWSGLQAGYEWRYGSDRLTLDGSRLGGYAVSNLHLRSDALVLGLTLSLTLQNLFDKHYANPAGDINWQNALEQDGRSLRLQALYRF